jgi:hypothetical protein
MKRLFSLLEVVIGLSLTALLLTILFNTYREISLMQGKVKQVRDQIHWELITQLRLNQVFETLSLGSLFYTEDPKFQARLFMTQNPYPVLHFKFDNGVDRDPQFGGVVMASLGLHDGDFSLLLKGQRKEVFLPNAKDVKFSFYDPTKKTWLCNWQGVGFPAMIKMEVNNTSFTFILPQAKHEATFL